MAAVDDKQLFIRIREGDKESFRILFERSAPRLLSFARRLTGNDGVAEDAVQNVFMRLWITRERIDADGNLNGYLQIAVRNEIYMHFRNAFNARREHSEKAMQVMPDDSVNVENDISAQQLGDIVAQAVEAMPARRREIFDMSRRRHLQNSEIAEKLGLSVRTVEKHIELALDDIRKLLPVPVVILITMLW